MHHEEHETYQESIICTKKLIKPAAYIEMIKLQRRNQGEKYMHRGEKYMQN
jgi:hypothetical protein